MLACANQNWYVKFGYDTESAKLSAARQAFKAQVQKWIEEFAQYAGEHYPGANSPSIIQVESVLEMSFDLLAASALTDSSGAECYYYVAGRDYNGKNELFETLIEVTSGASKELVYRYPRAALDVGVQKTINSRGLWD